METIEQQWEKKLLKRFNGDAEAMEKDFEKWAAMVYDYEGLTVAQMKRYSALREVDVLCGKVRECAEFFLKTCGGDFGGYELKVTESGVWAIFSHKGYAALAFEVRYGEYCYDETVVRTTVLDDSGLSDCIVSTERKKFFYTFDPSVFVERMEHHVQNPREIRRTVFHGMEEMVGRLNETKYGIWEGHAAIRNAIEFYERVVQFRRLHYRLTDEELERMSVWNKKYPWFHILLKKMSTMGCELECHRESFAEWAERLEKDLEESDAELAEFIRDLRTGKEKSQRVMREIMEKEKSERVMREIMENRKHKAR